MLGIIAEELVEGSDLAGAGEASDGMVFKADDDLVCLWREDRGGPGRGVGGRGQA